MIEGLPKPLERIVSELQELVTQKWWVILLFVLYKLLEHKLLGKVNRYIDSRAGAVFHWLKSIRSFLRRSKMSTSTFIMIVLLAWPVLAYLSPTAPAYRNLFWALSLGTAVILIKILGRKPKIEIVSHWDGDTVGFEEIVAGTLTDPDMPLELRVYAAGRWHRQSPVIVGGNRWRGKCQFGDKESQPGSAYRLIAIGKGTLEDKISELPDDVVRSNIVSVIRSQSSELAHLSAPSTVSGSRLRLGTPMGANIHPIGGSQSAMVMKVMNSEARFEYTVHNIKAELVFTYLQTKETFKAQALFATLSSNAIATNPVTSISLTMSQSCELLVLGRRLNEHFSLSQWPFDPAREKPLRCGNWQLDIDVHSDSATDRTQYHATVQLRSDGSSSWTPV